ncbi:MAG: protease complex subunit PrcB family protein [Methylococcales bacterium]
MKFLFWKLFLIVSLIGMSLSYKACAADQFSHTVLKLPYEPQNSSPWGKVINTWAEWSAFYGELLDANQPTPFSIALPEIDFDQYTLVAGGVGVKSSGGYVVSVASVDEVEDSVYIHVLNVSPGAGCPVTLMVKYPSTAILIKKATKPIRFFVTNVTSECPV